jgi:thioredoxin 1
MALSTTYERTEPTRAEVDSHDTPLVIEFGSATCGYCRAAQPHVAKAMAEHPGVRHLKIEDGSGRPLGRSFGVKLWPTLVFLSRGKEMARLVRPTDAGQIRDALRAIDVRD